MRFINQWILATLFLLETSQCRFTELDRILPDQKLPLHHPFAFQLGPFLGPKRPLPVLRNGYYEDRFYHQQKRNSPKQYTGLPSLTTMHQGTVRNHGILSPDLTSEVRYLHSVDSQNFAQLNVTKNSSNTRHGTALFLDFENYEAVVPPTDAHLSDALKQGLHAMSDGSINMTYPFSTANSVVVDMGGTHSKPLVETGLFSRISAPVHTVSDTGDQINQVKIGTGGMDTTSTVFNRLGIPPPNQLNNPSTNLLGANGETVSTLSMLPPHPRKFHRNRPSVETPTGKTAQLRVPTIRSFAHSVFLESSRQRSPDFHSPASDPRGNLNELEKASRQVSWFINRSSRPEVRGGVPNAEVHSMNPGRQSKAFHSSVPIQRSDDRKLMMKTPILDMRNRESVTSDRKSDSISGHHRTDLPNDLPYLGDNIVQERSVWSLATRKHRTKSATSTNIVISPTATDPLVSDFWWLSNNTTRNEPTTPTESSGFNRNESQIVTKPENSGPLELVSHHNPELRRTHQILDSRGNRDPWGSSTGFRGEDGSIRGFPFPSLQQLNSVGDQRDFTISSQLPDTNGLANLKVPVKDIPPKNVASNQISNGKPDQSLPLQVPTLGDGQGAFNLPWIQEVEKSTRKHSKQQSFDRNSINYTESSLEGYTVGPGHVFGPVTDTNNFTSNSIALQGNSSSSISLHIYMTQDRKHFDVAPPPVSQEIPMPKLAENIFHKETHENSLLFRGNFLKSNLTHGNDSFRAWLSPPLDRQLSAKNATN